MDPMALVQGTELLLLDEPTTYLDMAHQLEVLKLLRALNDEAGRTVVMVIHDLNHAARFAHHIIAIANGRVIMEGPPAHVVTPEERLFLASKLKSSRIRVRAIHFVFHTN